MNFNRKSPEDNEYPDIPNNFKHKLSKGEKKYQRDRIIREQSFNNF